MEDKGTILTPIFQFAKNNGLDEKEFFDFVKSKTGVDITPEHRETQGFLEKMFDEYADKKFKERPERDIFTDKYKEYLDVDDKLDHEVVNDKSIDAIKDNFTPPGAKGEKKMNKRMFAPDMLCPKCKEPMLYQAGGGRIKCSKCGNEVGEDTLDSLELYKSPNIEESEQLKDAIDTNDNGEIEVDEMADFQKSLDDYAAKNKKGRDDIPVTTRRR